MPKLPENCPICGEKMEKGYVVCPESGVLWSKEKEWLALKSRKAMRIKDAEIIVGRRFRAIWNVNDMSQSEAYKCPNCKIVLFSYGEEKEKE